MKKIDKRGFTLVELIVAVSLFLLVTTVVLGGLVSGIARERESRFKAMLQGEMSTFLDRLEREIHSARRIGCGDLEVDCDSGGAELFLEKSDGKVFSYELVGGEVMRSVDGADPEVAVSGFGGSINSLTFFVQGAVRGSGDLTNSQYVVIVTMNSSLGSGGEVYAFRYITPYSLDVGE